MKLSFYRLAVFTSALFLILAMIWMFAPVQLLSGWGVELSTAAGLVGRRAAALVRPEFPKHFSDSQSKVCQFH